MSKSIRESRIDAIKVIYSCHMNNTEAASVAATVITDGDDLAIKYALSTMSDIKAIDEIISNALVGYTLNRLNVVDRSIVELATYEMKNDVVAPAIAINEALEITKMYTDAGDKKEVKFNNKLLDNIRKQLGK